MAEFNFDNPAFDPDVGIDDDPIDNDPIDFDPDEETWEASDDTPAWAGGEPVPAGI